MKNTPYYFTLFLFISSCFSPHPDSYYGLKNKKLKTESGCTSVDDCISKYDFEGARAYMAIKPDIDAIHDDDIKNVTIAESKYWADKGEIDKSLTVIDESWGVDDYFWSEEDWQSWRYNIIDKGVATLCEKNEFKQAKGLALKAAEDINVDGFKIGSDTDEYDEDGNHIKAKGPSMQEALLKKINKYEELLK